MFIKQKDKISLVINGVVVKFDNVNDHSAYVMFEHSFTQAEFRDYAAAFDKTARATSRKRLDLARQRAYDTWLKKRGK